MSDLKAPWLQVDTYPKGLTFLDLLYYFVDIRPVPSQALLKILSENAQDNKEKVKLHKLGTKFDAYSCWNSGNTENVSICQGLLCHHHQQLTHYQAQEVQHCIYKRVGRSDVGLVVGVVDYTHKSGKRRF